MSTLTGRRTERVMGEMSRSCSKIILTESDIVGKYDGKTGFLCMRLTSEAYRG
jgi:hypothetical protein